MRDDPLHRHSERVSKDWFLRDTTERVGHGLMTVFGSRGSLALCFTSETEAQEHLSRSGSEYASRFEIVHRSALGTLFDL